jgi:putative membrane protein
MGAQTGTSQSAGNAPSGTNSSSASRADQTFVTKAASGNMAEVQMGKLAAQKSRNPAVQEFGRWMQTDHTMANALLMQAAKSSNIQVPIKPGPAAVKSMQKLQTVSGTQFNRQYIGGAVTDHQKTIKLFENEAQNGQDTQVKAFAKAMLPTLQAHLQEAQALQSNMSGNSTAGGAGGTSATGNTAVGAGNAGTAKLNAQELNKVQHR